MDLILGALITAGAALPDIDHPKATWIIAPAMAIGAAALLHLYTVP